MKLKDILLDLFGSPPEPDRPAPPRPAPVPPRAAPPPHPPREHGEARVLALLRKHGAPYERVVFTDNRRVMISVGRDRGTIRMNAAFADADEAVLAAVAHLYTRTVRGKKREQAKERVQRFIDAIPRAATPPRKARRHAHPADRLHLERLQAEFDRANVRCFGGRLPRVPIHLSRKMRRRNGHFSSHPLEIVISWRLCVHGEAGQAEETMRHEMIHLWQYLEGAAVDHGPAFRRMAHRLDVHPRATRPVKWKQG
ncbi:MAG TPA: SprT-like domain-containing protein [Longimicrobium sp.]